MEQHSDSGNESTISTTETGTPSPSPRYVNDNEINSLKLNLEDSSDSASEIVEHDILNAQGQSIDNRHGLSNLERDAPKGKTLFEMGVKFSEADGLENIQLPNSNHTSLLMEMVQEREHTNVKILIGRTIFECHTAVLQCYSQLFKGFSNALLVVLPEERVTPDAFFMIYNWMLADQPVIQRACILELFSAAIFLEIEELINQCWFCFSDVECFTEDSAFMLFLEARTFSLEKIDQIMLKRVSKFFLTLVASKEYLELSPNAVSTLLSSNTIGVNSETEILMSAIRWLLHSWEERQQHIADILKCVNFSIMPSWFLIMIKESNNVDVIDRIVSHPEVNKMINDGEEYVLKRTANQNDDNCTQRQWIYDKHCAYHHCHVCTEIKRISYKSFLDYLAHLREVGHDYWRTVKFLKDVGGINKPCGLHLDSNNTFKQTSAINSPQMSCGRGMHCDVDKGIDNNKGSNIYIKNPNSPHHRSNKRLLRRSRCKHKKPMMSPTIKRINNIHSTDSETEIETAVNLKWPQGNDKKDTWAHSHQQLQNILNDSKDHHHCITDMGKQKKHIATQRPTKSEDSSSERWSHKQQYRRQKQQQQQQEISLMKTHQQAIKQQTNTSNTVIYKHDDDKNATIATNTTSCIVPMPDANKVLVDIIGDTLAGQGNSSLNKIAINLGWSNDNNNVGSIVIREPGHVHDLEQSKRPKSATTEIDLKWRLKRKILIFGGIDPYRFFTQQHKQQHQNVVPHQRKNVFTMLASMWTQSIETEQSVDLSLPPKITTSSTSGVNKFGSLGDQVLIYESIDALEWRSLSRIPFGSRHHHAVAVCNGLIFLIGGINPALSRAKNMVFDKNIWCFDPLTNKWTMDTNMPESTQDFAVVVVDKEICQQYTGSKDNHEHETGFYVIGGMRTSGIILNSVWFYSVKRRVWIKKPPLKMGRFGLAAAIVNNEIWIAGGIINGPYNDAGAAVNAATLTADGYVITDTIEIYTLKCSHELLAQNVVVALENMRTNIAKTYGAIGNSYNVLNKRSSGVFEGVCDCTKGQWIISKHHLRVPRVFGRFCKMTNGELFLVGGIGPDGNGDLTSLADIDLYQIKQQRWQYCGQLKWPRHGHDVGLLNDHCFAVIGGVSTVDKCTLKQTEVFCTKTRKCLNQILPNLPWPVSGCSVASVLK